MNSKDYNFFFIDASIILRIASKSIELARIELAKRIGQFKELHPKGKCVLIYAGAKVDTSSTIHDEFLELARNTGWILLIDSENSSWDIIAWIAQQHAENTDCRCLFMSEDLRTLGLLSDKVDLYFRDLDGPTGFTSEEIKQKTNPSPDHVWARMALAGDPTLRFERMMSDQCIRKLLTDSGPITRRDQIGPWTCNLPLPRAEQDELADRLGLILPRQPENVAKLACMLAACKFLK